jgi:DNA mismatch repair protein MutS
MVEMNEMAHILRSATQNSLIVLDEIGRGTSTFDGLSIAWAVVEYLVDQQKIGAKTLFATHYHELNDLEDIYGRVRNFHIAVKEVGKNVIFLRKLKEGGVAHSFGLHVARMAGMPKQVLESAEKTLAALESHGHPERSEGSSAKKKNTIKPHNIKEGRVESDGSLQLSFFQLEDPLLASLKEELDNADLNNMTPLQAFDLLRSMKEQLGI